MKALKKLLIACVVLIALLAGVVIAIPYFFPLDRLRVELEKSINAQITGTAQVRDLKLSLFPWLGVRLGGLVIQNGEAFNKSEMLRVQEAGLRVDVMPLLQKRVVGEIIITKPVVRLETLADGRQSVNLIMKSKAGAEKAPATPTAPSTRKPWVDEIIHTAKIQRLNIQDAQLRTIEYDDKMQRKDGMDIAHLDVKLKNLQFKGEMPVEIAAAVFNSDKTDVEFKATIVNDVDLARSEQRFSIAKGTVNIGDISMQVKGDVVQSSKAPVHVNLQAESKGLTLGRLDQSLPMLKGKLPQGLQGDLSFQATAVGPTNDLKITVNGESKVMQPGIKPGLELQNTAFQISLAQKLLTIQKFNTQVLGGQLASSGTIALSDHRMKMTVDAREIDLQQANNMFGSTKDLITGALTASVQLEGAPVSAPPSQAGIVPAWLTSQGKMHIGKGKLATLNLMGDTIGALVKIAPITPETRAALSRVEWESMDANFQTDKGQLALRPYMSNYGTSMVGGNGTIAADGKLNFSGAILFPKETVKTMGVGFAELTNKKGEMEIPYKIGGTLSKPITYPDVIGLGKKVLKQEFNKIVTPEIKNTFKDLGGLLKPPQTE